MGYSAVCGSRCEDSANVWSQVFESYLLKKKNFESYCHGNMNLKLRRQQ